MSIVMIDYDMKYIKGVVHLKMKVLSSLTHPHFMVSETLRD